jgi:hypothetical protein
VGGQLRTGQQGPKSALNGPQSVGQHLVVHIIVANSNYVQFPAGQVLTLGRSVGLWVRGELVAARSSKGWRSCCGAWRLSGELGATRFSRVSAAASVLAPPVGAGEQSGAAWLVCRFHPEGVGDVQALEYGQGTWPELQAVSVGDVLATESKCWEMPAGQSAWRLPPAEQAAAGAGWLWRGSVRHTSGSQGRAA